MVPIYIGRSAFLVIGQGRAFSRRRGGERCLVESDLPLWEAVYKYPQVFRLALGGRGTQAVLSSGLAG